MTPKGKLTPEIAREFMVYDPSTGVFTWCPRDRKWFKSDRDWKAWNVRYSGRQAGSVKPSGYIDVAILDKTYRAHRLAWLLMTGSWPDNEIDHINHDNSDNRFANLRDVPHADNMRNMTVRADSTSGATGVHWSKKYGKWQAYIKVNRRVRHLGSFSEKLDAVAARKAAEREHLYHENHGAAA